MVDCIKMTQRKSSRAVHRQRQPRRGIQGTVRIIGGDWRSRRIAFPGENQLRPTPDRVRETLFNWLGQDIEGLRCLDLFAGSGALGLEAASRGAGQVTMVDNSPRVIAALHESVNLLGAAQVNVERADALEFLTRTQSRYDLVFLDPPFSDGLPVAVIKALPTRLAPGAVVYLEAGHEIPILDGWSIKKHARAGIVHFHLLQVA